MLNKKKMIVLKKNIFPKLTIKLRRSTGLFKFYSIGSINFYLCILN